MSQPPKNTAIGLGENYFQTRSQLERAVQGLEALCKKVETDPGRVNMLRNLMANLKGPFLFVVTGEVNSGKSTLLNAIFGADFCSTDVTPTTDRIAYFKFGKEAHEFDFSDDILEIYRPNEFLRDFNLVDTPGTDSMEARHQLVTEDFLPTADLVLFVFSVTNPWGASTWDLLERIHHQHRKKIIFVLQQCELRTEDEVAAILDHLKKTAQHRFGQGFPTFAVSAKQALVAKQKGLEQSTLPSFSRIDDLEDHISQVVESSEVRLTKMIHSWRAACFVLDEVKQKLSGSIEILRAEDELFCELAPAAEVQKSRSLKKIEGLFGTLDQSFMAAGLQAESLLDAQLGLLSALAPSRKRAGEIENLIFAITMKSVRNNVSETADELTRDIQKLFERVSTEMHEHYHLSLSVAQPDWEPSRGRVIEAVERATAKVLSELDLKEELVNRLRTRSRLIWINLFFAGLATGGGILLSLGGGMPWNSLAFAVAGFFMIISAVISARSVTGIRAFYRAILEERRSHLVSVQQHALGVAADHYFSDCVKVFDPLRKVCQQHRQLHKPQIIAMAECEKDLAGLEQILIPVEKMLER